MIHQLIIKKLCSLGNEIWFLNSKQRENRALVTAILFCGEYPGPRVEDKFLSANQMDGISIAR